MKLIKHPNVVRLYEVRPVVGIVCLVNTHQLASGVFLNSEISPLFGTGMGVVTVPYFGYFPVRL